VGVSIGWGNFDPTIAIVETMIHYNAESQLIHIEAQAALRVADINDREMETQIGILAV